MKPRHIQDRLGEWTPIINEVRNEEKDEGIMSSYEKAESDFCYEEDDSIQDFLALRKMRNLERSKGMNPRPTPVMRRKRSVNLFLMMRAVEKAKISAKCSMKNISAEMKSMDPEFIPSI